MTAFWKLLVTGRAMRQDASIQPEQYLAFAEGLGRLLSDTYGGRECAVYLLLVDDEIELRFHTIRENEPLWLDENLDAYDSPILCWIQE